MYCTGDIIEEFGVDLWKLVLQNLHIRRHHTHTGPDTVRMRSGAALTRGRVPHERTSGVESQAIVEYSCRERSQGDE